MPRQLRIEYPGAIYHLMSRGNREGNIFLEDADREDFLKTLAEACQKTGFQVHAYCLLSDHFHLVVETPAGNLVAGMRWFLSSYTIRFNRRHHLVGHVFSGRYKSLVVDGTSRGYLSTACDYAHLNPVRAKLLRKASRLREYPWSSFGYCLAEPAHRPAWLRVDRLLRDQGIRKDDPAGRRRFEELMEERRAEPAEESQEKGMRRGWFLGPPEFKARLLERIKKGLGEDRPGEARRESEYVKADRIVREELRRLGWKEATLAERAKGDESKLALAWRLRRETTLTVKEIAVRLRMGSWTSLNSRLYQFRKTLGA
jgi:REP element-mobilizing transposase RayT